MLYVAAENDPCHPTLRGSGYRGLEGWYFGGYIGIMEEKMETTIMGLYRVLGFGFTGFVTSLVDD